jgi:hypothetical protein
VLEREQNRPTVRRHAEILQGRGIRGVLSLPELTTILERERVLGTPIIQSLSSTKSILLRINKTPPRRNTHEYFYLVNATEVPYLSCKNK